MTEESSNHDIVPHPYSAIVKGGIRSIAASIPALALLGQAWNEYETHRTTQRIQELFDNLRAELEKLQRTVTAHADALDRHEDFPELLEIAIEKVRREFDEAKRSRYARVLARFLVAGNARSHDEKVSLLESMDLLSEADLRVLSLFGAKEDAQIADLRWRELGLPGDVNDQLWEMSCSLPKLESRGLILKVSTHTGAVYVQAQLNSDATRWEQTKYRVLPLGKSLIAVLFER
jgi:hypothetical protein